MPDTITRPDLHESPILEDTDGDDAPDAAHIVTQKDLIHSQLTGEAIRALCGKMWVPRRNPDDFPMCQACVEVFNRRGTDGPS